MYLGQIKTALKLTDMACEIELHAAQLCSLQDKNMFLVEEFDGYEDILNSISSEEMAEIKKALSLG